MRSTPAALAASRSVRPKAASPYTCASVVTRRSSNKASGPRRSLKKRRPTKSRSNAALKLLEQAAQGDEPLGTCPETGKPVYMKVGRFGPYVQRGTMEDEEKPQNASLLKGMNPSDIDLETALKLLTLPRNLGNHPEKGEPIMAYNGRFGPYIKSGDDTRSLPAEISPLDVTLEQAVHLLAQPKTHGRGRAAAKREPLKVFEESPVTKQKVQLLDGRYGPYVTDGETNASLPKGTAVEELTFPEALDLLAARAAAGPPKKKAKKKAAKSAKTTKAAATGDAPKKSATKRRTPKAAPRRRPLSQRRRSLRKLPVANWREKAIRISSNLLA